jgi:hypothetical protein
VFFRGLCDISIINKEEWTILKNDEKPHSENLIVPPHTEELRNSSNSDIISSFSDDDDQKTESEYPIGGGKRSTRRKPLTYFIT